MSVTEKNITFGGKFYPMQLRLIAGIVVAILLVIFALQNGEPIVVKLWFWEVQNSLAVILMIMLLMGAALGAFFSIPGYMKNKKVLAEKKKRIAELEQQLTETHATTTFNKPDEDTPDDHSEEDPLIK